jgi:FkbM family methyltransferase
VSFVSYAQNLEDVMLRRVFRDVENGFYVDVGAWEPDIDSVTKAFYEAGWRGINIEPGPVFFRLAQRRPRDINLQLAIGAREGRLPLHVHHSDDTVLGTSTLQAGIPSDTQSGHLQIEECEVEVRTLAQVLDAHAAGQHIHFLKIDAEGAEHEILQGAHWQRHRPELLVIEATRPNSPERNDAVWTPLLVAAGYRAVWFDGLNAWFLREESMARAPAFTVPPNVFDDFRVYDHETAQRLAAAEAWGRSLEEVVLNVQGELSRMRDTAAAMEERYALMDERYALHEAALAENRALLEARWRLIHRLEMPDGPRLVRMVLPALRMVRRLLRRGHRDAALPPNLVSPQPRLPAPAANPADERLGRSIENALITLALRGGQHRP